MKKLLKVIIALPLSWLLIHWLTWQAMVVNGLAQTPADTTGITWMIWAGGWIIAACIYWGHLHRKKTKGARHAYNNRKP